MTEHYDARRRLAVEGRHTDYCALREPGDDRDCDCGLIEAIEAPTEHQAVWCQKGNTMRTEPLLTPEDTAEYLGIPLATLYQWRYRRTGPPALKVGRHLRYRARDLETWLDEQADPRPAGCAGNAAASEYEKGERGFAGDAQ